jgi:hypothetical protein
MKSQPPIIQMSLDSETFQVGIFIQFPELTAHPTSIHGQNRAVDVIRSR